MILAHFISRAELDRLFAAVAKPGKDHATGGIVWIAPAWWYALVASATH